MFRHNCLSGDSFPQPHSTHSEILCFFAPRSDNTAGIRMEGAGFNRHEQNVYFLPILVVDSGPPSLSSTGTLTIHVCGCDTGENPRWCRAITWHHCHCHRACSRKGRFRRCLLSADGNSDKPSENVQDLKNNKHLFLPLSHGLVCRWICVVNAMFLSFATQREPSSPATPPPM